jgi:hypothetical protein
VVSSRADSREANWNRANWIIRLQSGTQCDAEVHLAQRAATSPRFTKLPLQAKLLLQDGGLDMRGWILALLPIAVITYFVIYPNQFFKFLGVLKRFLV